MLRQQKWKCVITSRCGMKKSWFYFALSQKWYKIGPSLVWMELVCDLSNSAISNDREWPWVTVAKVLWKKFLSDSVHVAPLETAGIITVEMIPYCGQISHRTRGCLAWVRWGPRSGGSALLVVGFSVLVSILLCTLSMSAAALSTWLMRALSHWGSCSWLGECKGSWMVGYWCSCPRCAVTRHLEQ